MPRVITHWVLHDEDLNVSGEGEGGIWQDTDGFRG